MLFGVAAIRALDVQFETVASIIGDAVETFASHWLDVNEWGTIRQSHFRKSHVHYVGNWWEGVRTVRISDDQGSVGGQVGHNQKK